MKVLPLKLKILDVDYPILYFESPIDVDLNGKEEFASQWDVQDDVIRVHQGERSWKGVCHVQDS